MRLSVIALAAALLPLPAAAQEGAGGQLFRQNCAICHGLEARGDGPMNGILTIPIPDLRQLSARNGGSFPMLYVVATIDGRDMTRAHAGLMPVFGFSMGGGSVALDGENGAVLETRGDIVAIARWLETIQE